jgi:S1-C subfamily serine protease
VRVALADSRSRRCSRLWPKQRGPFAVDALVVSVESGSPAERAGLAPGMVIGTVNGVKMKTADDVLAAIAHERPGARRRLGLTTYSGTPLFHVLVLGRQRARR